MEGNELNLQNNSEMVLQSKDLLDTFLPGYQNLHAILLLLI